MVYFIVPKRSFNGASQTMNTKPLLPAFLQCQSQTYFIRRLTSSMGKAYTSCAVHQGTSTSKYAKAGQSLTPHTSGLQ